MSLRERLEKNPAIVWVALILVISGAALLIWRQVTVNPAGAAGGQRVYVFDLADGSLIAMPGGGIPPFRINKKNAEGGEPTGVLATVYSCGDCSSAKDRVVGYLETNSPAAQEAIKNALRDGTMEDLAPSQRASLEDVLSAGQLVAAGDTRPPTWVTKSSEQGQAIVNGLASKCPSGEFKICMP